MAVGPVNQALLESNYQNPGDIYLDTKTEGAFQVVVNQVNENAGIFSTGGSDLIYSDPITGVTGSTVYDQLVSMEAQIQAAIGGLVPPNTITTAMLQDGAVTTPKLASGAVTNIKLADGAVSHLKLDASEQTASVGGTQYSYLINFGF